LKGQYDLPPFPERNLILKSIKRNSHLARADVAPGATEPGLARLASLISAHTPYDGSFELCIPGVYVASASRTNTELVHGVAKPSLCIIAQGAKSVMLGQEAYEYDASRMLIFSIDLPVSGMQYYFGTMGGFSS
jgi:hypothetical protein